MKIGFVQFAPVFGEKQENFRLVECLLAGCKADLIVLPELFATGYTFVSAEEVFALSEEKDKETSRFAVKLASSCDGRIPSIIPNPSG